VAGSSTRKRLRSYVSPTEGHAPEPTLADTSVVRQHIAILDSTGLPASDSMPARPELCLR
jgi:hypothetical protein